jgi:CheY-like chemotaxis protein
LKSPAEKPTLLIVDDEPLNRDLLRRVLAREYAIEEAPDGQAALELLCARSFDVVLADHAMPYLSGVELLSRARTETPVTVGLLVTGYDELPEVHEAAEQGIIFGVIPKPFDHNELVAVVRRAAQEAAARRAKKT